MVSLSRTQASQGIYPAVDPLRSGSKLMDRQTLGDILKIRVTALSNGGFSANLGSLAAC
jgi:F0F1-type ATP synthase beta subunit